MRIVPPPAMAFITPAPKAAATRIRIWTAVMAVEAIEAEVVRLDILPAMLDAFARQMLYPAPPVPVPSPPPPPLEEVRLDLAMRQRRPGRGCLGEARRCRPRRRWSSSSTATARIWRRCAGPGCSRSSAGSAWRRAGRRTSPATAAARTPSEEGLNATGDAAVAWAREHHPERPLVVAGWSLGAALAIATVDRHPEQVRGLIALSPWTTLARGRGGDLPGVRRQGDGPRALRLAGGGAAYPGPRPGDPR